MERIIAAIESDVGMAICFLLMFATLLASIR